MKKIKMKMKYLKCDLAQVLLNLLRSNALVDVEFSVLKNSKITCICMARQVFIFLVLRCPLGGPSLAKTYDFDFD